MCVLQCWLLIYSVCVSHPVLQRTAIARSALFSCTPLAFLCSNLFKKRTNEQKIYLQSRPSYSENTQTLFWVVSCRNHLVSGELQPANPKNCAANYHHSPAEGTPLTFTSCHTEHDPSVSARRVVKLGGFGRHVRGVDGRRFYVALRFCGSTDPLKCKLWGTDGRAELCWHRCVSVHTDVRKKFHFIACGSVSAPDHSLHP